MGVEAEQGHPTGMNEKEKYIDTTQTGEENPFVAEVPEYKPKGLLSDKTPEEQREAEEQRRWTHYTDLVKEEKLKQKRPN